MARISFHIGRYILGMVVLAMGFFVFQEGGPIYDKYLHSLRKMYLPHSRGSDMINYLNISY